VLNEKSPEDRLLVLGQRSLRVSPAGVAPNVTQGKNAAVATTRPSKNGPNGGPSRRPLQPGTAVRARGGAAFDELAARRALGEAGH
jgi:hypothetical protein